MALNDSELEEEPNLPPTHNTSLHFPSDSRQLVSDSSAGVIFCPVVCSVLSPCHLIPPPLLTYTVTCTNVSQVARRTVRTAFVVPRAFARDGKRKREF